MVYTTSNNLSLLLPLIIIIVFTGCTPKVMSVYESSVHDDEGARTWDYQEHAKRLLEREIYQSLSKRLGTGGASLLLMDMGSNSARLSLATDPWLAMAHMPGDLDRLVVGMLVSQRIGLALTPTELHKIISQALLSLKSEAPTKSETPRQNQLIMTMVPQTPLASEETKVTHETAAEQWKVVDSTPEEIVTDWNPVPGRTSGILIWEKQYETEVRHRITIKPSIDSQNWSGYVITTEVRERPNRNYPWARGSKDFAQKPNVDITTRLAAAIAQALLDKDFARQHNKAPENSGKARMPKQ